MRVFRLSKRKYASELNGKGAAKFGNRWNSKGTEIIYTAESRALAMAEIVVHLPLGNLPSDYVMIEIEIPEEVKISKLSPTDLSTDWNSHPPIQETQKIGDAFIDDMEFCVLKVPSAVVKGDYNYLINPYHRELKKINILSIEEFPFDKRIFKA